MSALIPEPRMKGVTRAYTIETMVDNAKSASFASILDQCGRNLFCWVLPSWQRDHVWCRSQQQAFIEGIFDGFGTGYYVVNEPDWYGDGEPRPMSGWLLDGQQRITAIRDFMAGEFTIFEGIFFEDIDRVTRVKRFLRQPFPCLELEYQSEEGRLKELYQRLNFGGTPHTQADLERVRA